MTTAALEFRNVSLTFGSTTILKDINFTVPESSSLVLVGPSGAGKSLLLKLAAGLITPSSGEVWIQGKNLKEVTPAETQKTLLQMGMLFQRNALFDSLSVFENVAFPLRERSSMTEAEISDRVLDLLHAVGLDQSKNLLPHEISGGMQKRLGVARALALKPKILFYDDPTAGLDPITSRKIANLLTELMEKNRMTTLTITNDMMRALQLADQIGFVFNKNVEIIGNPNQSKSSSKEPFRSFFRGLPID